MTENKANHLSVSHPHLLVQRQHSFFADVSFCQIDCCEQRKQRREPSKLMESAEPDAAVSRSLPLPLPLLLVFIFFCLHEQNTHKCTVPAELLTIICVLSWPLLRGPEVRRLVGQKQNECKGRPPSPAHHQMAPNTVTVVVLAGLISSESSKNVFI